jgi:biotin transport system substrate-specific component
MTAAVPTLATRLWPRTEANSLPRAAALVLVGTLLLALAAHVKVPFWPVPMTMETFAVLVIGASYGRILAGATLIAFLVEGALGLPVFTGTVGPAAFVGTTGGYLAGFLVAAVAAGWAAERGLMKGPAQALAVFLLCDVVIFVLGVAWLSTLIGLDKAIAGGALPFLLGDALKIVLATAVMLATTAARVRAR